jgi:hypothetical protein
VTLIGAVLLLFAVIVATEAYRRTGPLPPRATVVLAVAIVLVVLWVLDLMGALRLGRWT